MRPCFLAGALALTCAGAAVAQSTMSHSGMRSAATMNASPGDPAAALSTSDYLAKAAQSDRFEIHEGQLASSMGRSPAIRAFGREMVAAHRKTTASLLAALKSMGEPPPATSALSADQQAQIDQLRGLSGSAFDKAYVDQQLAAHHEALMVQANYARGGSDPKLRQVAASTAPIVQHHLKTLMALQAQTGGAT